MAYTQKPRLNDMINGAIRGTKFTISINNPGGVGRAVTCKGKGHNGEERTWIAYVYDVICERKEYSYWVNSDNHRIDIEKLTKAGNRTVTIEAVDYYNEETGKTTTMYDVRPSGTDLSTNPAIAPTTTSYMPPSSAEEAKRADMEMYRHEYALEVFKGLIREKQELVLTDKIKTIICMWARYSAGLDPIAPSTPIVQAPQTQPDSILSEEEVDSFMNAL